MVVLSTLNRKENQDQYESRRTSPSEMPRWYYDKSELKKTPSAEDGIPFETECRYRSESARFIIKVGLEMSLRYDTMATGVVYMHRFYMRHSFKTFSRFVTACSCLFLAGKVEETPKKCRDIIKTAKGCMTQAQFLTFGEDPRETVMIMERILLQTINFDLQVDHPYRHLLNYTKTLRGETNHEQCTTMVQMAWTFINDSLCTMICLQWEPEVVAIAVMFLAGKLSKFDLESSRPDGHGGRSDGHGGRSDGHGGRSDGHGGRWWDAFAENVTVDLLEDICHQILDLYTIPVPENPRDSPPPNAAQQPVQGMPIPTTGGGQGTNHVNNLHQSGSNPDPSNSNYRNTFGQAPPPHSALIPPPVSVPGPPGSGSGAFGGFSAYGFPAEGYANDIYGHQQQPDYYQNNM